MLLSSTTDQISMITGSAGSIDYAVVYAIGDKTSSPMVIKDADTSAGNIATATTTNISGSPGAANDRWSVTEISIRNAHATVANDITIQYIKVGATARTLIKVNLLPGEKLQGDKNGVWFKYDATGGVKTALSAPSTRVVLTAGSGATYTTPAGCRAIDVEVIAGGGAGGGATSVAASGGGGGGGGSGGITRKLFSPPAASYLYTIGAGGTPGAAGAAGGAGADSTFGTLTAKGGSGGAFAASAAATRALGGAGGVVGSGGDINGAGEPGRTGFNTTAALVASGAGGPSEAGGGAPGVIAQGAGVAAAANSGGGGSGGASISAGAAVAGGAGGSGVIIVTEYY